MGGGGGLGLFVGTAGSKATDSYAAGTLVAAVLGNTATDAGGKPAGEGRSSFGDILGAIRPWWTLPYGHPEKTQTMRELQSDLKPRLEGLARGFIEGDKKDLKSWVISQGAKLLSRQIQKNRKKSKKD